MRNDNDDRRKENTLSSTDERFQEPNRKLWSIFIFGLIGATITTFSMYSIMICAFLNHIHNNCIGKESFSFQPCTIKDGQAELRPLSSVGGADASSFRSCFREEGRKIYGHHMLEEYEEDLDSVKHIRCGHKMIQAISADDWYRKTDVSMAIGIPTIQIIQGTLSAIKCQITS